MKNLKEYNLKWLHDLNLYLPIYGTFVIEGNINDCAPVASEASGELEYSYSVLSGAIAERYQKDYCVVFLDHTKQEGKLVPKLDADKKVQKDASGANITEMHFGSLEFFDREGNPENVKLLEKYYSDEFKEGLDKSLIPGVQSALTRDMIRIRETMAGYVEGSTPRPFMFILRNVSRFMVRPGDPSAAEYHALNMLFQITQLSNTQCKLIIMVDKMNDLPPWFESEHSNQKIRKIFVAGTDSDFRQKFYLDMLSDVFEPDYSLLRRNHRYLDRAQREQYEKMLSGSGFSKHMKKFAAYTEGFSVGDLIMFKAFVEQHKRDSGEPARLDDVQSLVLRFKYGQADNPWLKKNLLQTIKNLPEEIKKIGIVGQDKAIAAVTNGLLHAVTGIARIKEADRRPRAIFFFAGPTGTGKTEIAKQLASNIFGSEDSMVRFDMSEFSASHTDSRLFGAPPGYVGYDAGGELTQAIKQNPFTLILFDEIEKANTKILDKFLQILGDGRLTDGKGETVYFTDTVIVFTSNCGITGFDWKPNPQATFAEFEAMKREAEEKDSEEKRLEAQVFETVQRGLKAEMCEQFDSAESFNNFVEACVKKGVEYYFTKIMDPGKPELLGRIGSDNIISFNFMNKDSAASLLKNTAKGYAEFLRKSRGITLEISDEVNDFILLELRRYDVLNLGARGIIMRAEAMLKTPIAGFLADFPEAENTAVTLVLEDESIVVRQNQ